MSVHICACGRCGISFEVARPLRGQRRKYAVDCPYREQRALAQRREASRVAYERRRKQNPRRCSCGCGRELPRYVRFHPDCETRDGRHEERKPVTPGKSGRCAECYDQGWRRDPNYGCLRCGRPYHPERPASKEVPMQSSLGRIIG